jgi:hypothetical protein
MKRRLLIVCTIGIALAAAAPSSAETVQSTQALTLTGKFTLPTSTGARMISIRVTTRDLIEATKDALFLQGRSASLVMRRDIDDLNFSDAESFLLLDGTYYPIPPGPPGPDLDLPESFDGFAQALRLRPQDGVPTSVSDEGTTAFVLGDFATDGFEATLIGIARRSARLLTHAGFDVGYLFSSVQNKVIGGLMLELDGEVEVGVLTGSLRNGPEKIVVP